MRISVLFFVVFLMWATISDDRWQYAVAAIWGVNVILDAIRGEQ